MIRSILTRVIQIGWFFLTLWYLQHNDLPSAIWAVLMFAVFWGME